MDDKNLDYILRCMRATDVCEQGVRVAMDALIKQAKINKRQRLINVLFSICAMTTVAKIAEMKQLICKQNEVISKLIGAIDGDTKETESKKGE